MELGNYYEIQFLKEKKIAPKKIRFISRQLKNIVSVRILTQVKPQRTKIVQLLNKIISEPYMSNKRANKLN